MTWSRDRLVLPRRAGVEARKSADLHAFWIGVCCAHDAQAGR